MKHNLRSHRFLLLSASIFLAGVLCRSQAATCTWTGAWDVTPSSSSDVIIIDGSQNLTWDSPLPYTVAAWTNLSSCSNIVTLATIYGSSGFTNLTVTGDMTINGGTLTHKNNGGATQSYRLRFTVNGKLNVASNGVIAATGLGFLGQGKAVNDNSGASYGGLGSCQATATTVYKPVYGSIKAPVDLGSMGHNGNGTDGAPGGGAIYLIVQGNTALATGAVVSANGVADYYGGGSGGSVFLTTASLSGGGLIQAKGATAGSSICGDGGGGRIAVILTGSGNDFSAFNGSIATAGGSGGGTPNAAAGTVYLEKTADSGKGTLLIDNANNLPDRQLDTRMPSSVDLGAFSNIIITNKAILGIAADTTVDLNTAAFSVCGRDNSYIHFAGDANVTYPATWVISNMTVYGDGISKTIGSVTVPSNGRLSHMPCRGTTVSAYRLNLTLTGDMTVQSGGQVIADGFGYWTLGPGGGAQNTGGSHGGFGGCGDGTSISPASLPGPVYDSMVAPTNVGSAGHGVNAYDAPGGGSIGIKIGGTLTLPAGSLVSASGTSGSWGGGSGGSVFLTAGNLVGSGAILASGGNGGGTGAGGGGRISIVVTNAGADFSSWSGTNTAYAGVNNYPGSSGTVYLQKPADNGKGTLIIDNNNTAMGKWYESQTRMPPGADLGNCSNIILTNKGVLAIISDTKLDLNTAVFSCSGWNNSGIRFVADSNVTYPTTWLITNMTVYGDGITKALTNVIVAPNALLCHQPWLNYDGTSFMLNLTIRGNLTVQSGGQIFADAYGPWNQISALGNGGNTGGSYGGKGGPNGANDSRATYGSIFAPTNTGSAGHATGANDAPGGGCIILSVGGTTTLAGGSTISAAGGYNGDSWGCGSGGGIFLTTSNLLGSGTIAASGASGGCGAGGGGRISLVLTGPGASFSGWTGTNIAYGGPNGNAAAAGTIYTQSYADGAGHGSVLVDNNNTATNQSYTALPAYAGSLENLAKTKWVVQNRGRLRLVNTSVSLSTLTLNTNAFLELAGNTLTLNALTLTNRSYWGGTYTAAQLGSPLVTDGGVGGLIIIHSRGTSVFFH